jgi:hypothetical protein
MLLSMLLVSSTVSVYGCRGGPGDYVVSGSAYVESERPDGKAVAKVEVQYRPPTDKREENHPSISPTGASPTGASLGAPESTHR